MQVVNQQELPGLAAFYDGFEIRPQNPMSPEFAGEAKTYLEYAKPNNAFDPQHVVLHAATVTINELQNAFNWVAGELTDTDLTLDFKLDDTPFFFAQCQPTSDRPNRALRIFVGLGCVPTLVGITNRVLHVQGAGPNVLEFEMQGRLSNLTSMDKWHPLSNPVGGLFYDYGKEYNTSTSTADSVLLLFFHEIAHALRGHSWIKRNANFSEEAHRRALESDADWCAGYLFVKYELLKLSAADRLVGENLTKLCERLAVASISLNTALQVKSDLSSELYHLPHIRTMDNSYGAELAWSEFDLSSRFIDLINEAYGQFTLLDRIFGPRLEQWVARDDPRNIADEAEMKALTEPIIRGFHEEALLLERGPIKGARAKWESIIHPKPTYRPNLGYYSYRPIRFLG